MSRIQMLVEKYINEDKYRGLEYDIAFAKPEKNTEYKVRMGIDGEIVYGNNDKVVYFVLMPGYKPYTTKEAVKQINSWDSKKMLEFGKDMKKTDGDSDGINDVLRKYFGY